MENQSNSKRPMHSAVALGLHDLGVETLFGLIGDANLYLVDSFIRETGGRYVPAMHEAGAVLMALGYAQVSGKVGVATITHGPALTNALTALVEGVRSSVPMVLLAGDTPAEDNDHLQDINQRELILGTGAGFEQLRSPETWSQGLVRAFRRASLELRPIVFNMPVNFQWREVDCCKPTLYLAEDRAVIPSSVDLDNAIGIIAASRRPIILAGRGAMAPEAKVALVRLAERIGAPLATTLRGSGLFAGEAFDLGIFGTLSTAVALETIMECDCVIAFGASLNRYTTGMGSLVKGKRIIQVNPRPSDVGMNLLPDAGLVGDPALTADAIVGWLDAAEISSSGFADSLVERLASFKPTSRGRIDLRPGTVDIISSLRVLNEAVPADRVFVTDAGRFLYAAWSEIRVQHPSSFVYTCGFASIGLGVAHAVGAAAAAPERTTLLVSGDGGFMLGGLGEFISAVRMKSDMIVVICNDGSYGAEHIQFRNKNMDPSLSMLDLPDFAPLAERFGAVGVTVRSTEDLGIAVRAIQNRDKTRPLLIDLKLDVNHVPNHGD